MLRDIIPAVARQAVYTVYAVGVVALGVAAILQDGLTVAWAWLPIAESVWLYLGAAVGAVAAGNINQPPAADR